jgi:hypothetical protein
MLFILKERTNLKRGEREREKGEMAPSKDAPLSYKCVGIQAFPWSKL